MHRLIFKVVFVACLSVFYFHAYADEITDQIDKAKTLYSQGKYSQAISELNFAVGQIQSLQIERYKTVFPAALAGWQAQDFESGSAGMMMMGGGTAVSRNYSTNNDETSVRIEIVADSPLLSSLMMMISNPMFLGGNKVVTVGGQKAVEEWSDTEKSGQLQIIVDNRIVIIVSGNGLTGKDQLYSYANKVDINKLKSL